MQCHDLQARNMNLHRSGNLTLYVWTLVSRCFIQDHPHTMTSVCIRTVVHTPHFSIHTHTAVTIMDFVTYGSGGQQPTTRVPRIACGTFFSGTPSEMKYNNYDFIKKTEFLIQ